MEHCHVKLSLPHSTSRQKNKSKTNFVAVGLLSSVGFRIESVLNKCRRFAFSAKEAITLGFWCASTHRRKKVSFSYSMSSVEQLILCNFYESKKRKF